MQGELHRGEMFDVVDINYSERFFTWITCWPILNCLQTLFIYILYSNSDQVDIQGLLVSQYKPDAPNEVKVTRRLLNVTWSTH